MYSEPADWRVRKHKYLLSPRRRYTRARRQHVRKLRVEYYKIEIGGRLELPVAHVADIHE